MTDAKLDHPLVRLADHVAELAHAGQCRKWSAIPYIVHPRRVAALVARLDGTNEVDVAAALLHDVVEDTPLDEVELKKCLELGGADPAVADEVVGLVVELTKPYRSEEGLAREEKRRRDWAKLKSASDRAKRLKLCDRLDNLIGGEPMPADLLPNYLAESEQVAVICGDADPILGGWLLSEISRRKSGVKEV